MKHVDRFHRFVFNNVEFFIFNLFFYSHKQYHDSIRRKFSIISTISYVLFLFIHLFILLTSYVNFFVEFRNEYNDKFDKHALSSVKNKSSKFSKVRFASRQAIRLSKFE